MGFLEDAKDAVEDATDKVGKVLEEGADRAKDKLEELKAEAAVKKAEAHRDAVRMKNEVKKEFRD